MSFTQYDNYTTVTIKFPGGQAEIILYGPFFPLPEDIPNYVAMGQAVVWEPQP